VGIVTDPIEVEKFSSLPTGEKRSISQEVGKYFITFSSKL
jgi:hypothetical protein